MSLITWKDSYSVGVSHFDSQHKVLFNLINDLHEAMREGKGRDKVADVLGVLISYTRGHFTAEELALKSAAYPEYDSHKQAHDAFVAKVLAFEKEFKAGKTNLSLELMEFLQHWLTGHIMETDKQYASYLKH